MSTFASGFFLLLSGTSNATCFSMLPYAQSRPPVQSERVYCIFVNNNDTKCTLSDFGAEITTKKDLNIYERFPSVEAVRSCQIRLL